ncbi:MAG: Si-specific NAD(P)(+) transhydrogenase [Polyangia bacterium]
MKRYDLCVIGSGPGGRRLAREAAGLGRSAVVVERMEVVGGVAVNTGTIPSKALREAVMTIARRGDPLAPPGRPSAEGATIEELLGHCNRIVEKEIAIIERQLAAEGVDLVQGSARLLGGSRLRVEGSGASAEIEADRIAIAVGTEPARPAGIPFDGQSVITSDDLLAMERLPRSMLVVGGGVIGSEYTSIFAQLGVRVTLVEGRERLLGFVDQEIGEALQYQLRGAGVTLRLGEKVERIRTARLGGKPAVEAGLASGKTLRAESLLYCVGRRGATDGLGLSAAGLEADSRGRISVDGDYRTSNPDVWAVGDVIGFPALASTAMEQGRVAARRMFGEPAEPLPELFPFGIYTIPEISMVGPGEAELTAGAVPYESGTARYGEIARAQLLGDESGMLKLLVHQSSHELLGVHAIGTGATELIHIGQLAIAFGATVEYLAEAIFNYPTLAECYKVAARDALDRLRSS